MQIASIVLLLTASTGATRPRRLGQTCNFATKDAAADAPVSFSMRSRVFVPHGFGDGYGYGMGATEKTAYDHKEKYLYSLSEQGYVNVVDYSDPSAPAVQKSLAIDLQGKKLTDVNLCPEKQLLFVSHGASDTVSSGRVRVYSTAKRSTSTAAIFKREITTGPLPDMLSPSNDCTMLAVACEGEGDIIDGQLVDPEGSLTLVRKFDTEAPEVFHVKLSGLGSDDDLIAKGVHLPLPLKAMEYWDVHSDVAGDLDFSAARAGYNAAMNLEPEYLGWSYDDSKVYVNLQENSAIVTLAVPTGAWSAQSDFALRIDAMGLKDWSANGLTAGIDLIKDDKCDLKKYPGFKTMRQADSIAVVTIDGENYVVAACEGDDKEYGDFEEKHKLKGLVDQDGNSLLAKMAVSAEAKKNIADQNALGADASRRVTVGSSAIDYSDPSAPIFNETVGFGGRGVAIYKDTGSAMELTWDSNSALEVEGCKHFPWSHNSIQDEEFAPINGVFWNSTDDGMKETLREMNDPDEDGCSDAGDGQPGACPLSETVDSRSPKDGAAPESMAVGEACGRLLAVTATEKSGIAFVYDITKVTSPQLLFVEHLTPASKTKAAGLAYEAKSIGEVDPEGVLFVDAAQSPSGKAGVLFGGAWSGTVSFWEFECPSSYSPSASASAVNQSESDGSDSRRGLASTVMLALALSSQ